MPVLRWPPAPTPRDELGVVGHGPALLARSPGVAAGLQCVFTHPGGLHLPMVLRAEGVQAEAASRGDRHRWLADTSSGQEPGSDPYAGPTLIVGADGEQRSADPGRSEGSSGHDTFERQMHYWIGCLPADGTLELTIGWPRAGLAQTTTALQLASLDDLAGRVLRLL